MTAGLLLLALSSAVPCPTQSLRLDVVRAEGAGACPSGQQLTELVQARLQCSPFEGEVHAWFEALIQSTDEGWVADLARFDAQGERSSIKRLVSRAPDCAVLAQVLALTVSVIASDLPRLKATTSATIGDALPAKVPTATVARGPVVPSSRIWTQIINSPPRGGLSAELVVDVGTMPFASFGARLAGSLQLGRFVEGEMGVLVLPARADDLMFFGLVAGSVGACGRYQPLRSVLLRGCLRAYGGAITVYEGNGARPREPEPPLYWFATSAGAHLTTPLLGPVSLQLGAEALVTLVDRTVEAETAEGSVVRVLDEAPVALLASVGLVFRFR